MFLFGRRTYEDLYEVWPKPTGDPMGEALTNTPTLTNTPKYVASRTQTEPLLWSNSILLDADATDAVAKLKKQPIGTLTIFGSGELIKSLMQADLIDEYLLMIHPLVLGTGRRMFPDGVHASLRLTDSMTTSTGVVIATYEPALLAQVRPLPSSGWSLLPRRGRCIFSWAVPARRVLCHACARTTA